MATPPSVPSSGDQLLVTASYLVVCSVWETVPPQVILTYDGIRPRCLGIGCYTPSWHGGLAITRMSAAGGDGSSHVKAVRAPGSFLGGGRSSQHAHKLRAEPNAL